jgi:hypothetical protein
VLAQVQIRAGGDVLLMPVGNISAGGVLLKVEKGNEVALNVGDKVSIYLDLEPEKRGARLAVDVAAEVVRVNSSSGKPDHGIAFMWATQDANLMEKLSQILAAMTKKA